MPNQHLSADVLEMRRHLPRLPRLLLAQGLNRLNGSCPARRQQ
jgi:hypothetical protein